VAFEPEVSLSKARRAIPKILVALLHSSATDDEWFLEIPAQFGPNPTLTLVANSQNPHSSTDVSRIKSWVPSSGRQFATSVNKDVTRGNKHD
jgi:hypothetical protein